MALWSMPGTKRTHSPPHRHSVPNPKLLQKKSVYITNIILTYVDTFTANSDSHIDSIVDEERYTSGFCDVMQLFGLTNQLLGIASLLTELDDGHTWL